MSLNTQFRDASLHILMQQGQLQPDGRTLLFQNCLKSKGEEAVVIETGKGELGDHLQKSTLTHKRLERKTR